MCTLDSLTNGQFLTVLCIYTASFYKGYSTSSHCPSCIQFTEHTVAGITFSVHSSYYIMSLLRSSLTLYYMHSKGHSL